MKKLIFGAIPLAILLTGCSDAEDDTASKEQVKTEQVEESTEQTTVSENLEREWAVDDRLQEPTAETVCAMCNMKVYEKDHEMGVFSAQAIKADGSIAFYDDIGCLLNAEFANNEVNEKYVRDYNTLNWFIVEEAYIVKTKLKSPMNWGYIFFKYEEDAAAYIAENAGATLTSYTEVRQQALERRKAKQAAGEHVDSHHHEDGHVHAEGEGHTHGEMDAQTTESEKEHGQ